MGQNYHPDMQLIARSSESHYYAYEHETGCIIPMYDVPNKSKGGTRSVTLADAKKNGYLVGISTIANMLPKPQLVNWRISQAVLASLTLPRNEGEELDAYANRVIADAEAQSTKAKEFGTRIHDGIEKILRGVSPDPDLEPWLKGFRQWANEWIIDIEGLEQVVGDPALGVAGRLDIRCVLKDVDHVIIDVKTQNIKKAPTFWKEWAVQLSGYQHCVLREFPDFRYRILSLIVNTAEPGPVHWQLWPDYDYFAVFQHCLALWTYANDYSPAQL